MSFLFDGFHPNKQDIKKLNREGIKMMLEAIADPDGFKKKWKAEHSDDGGKT